MLINPTNGASYTGTIVQTQQVASSGCGPSRPAAGWCRRRRPGFSEFVTPDGDVVDRTAVSERAVIRHVVALRTGRTWYVSLGDGPWIVLVALTLAAALVLAGLDRRQRRFGPDPGRTGDRDPDQDAPDVVATGR